MHEAVVERLARPSGSGAMRSRSTGRPRSRVANRPAPGRAVSS